MYQFLLVAVLVAAAFGEKDQEQVESAHPFQIFDDDLVDDFHHEEPLPGPHVLRSPRSWKIAEPDDHGPEAKKQNVIIRKTYDPDYYEPTIILDYRYMKTGGRDYARGPGGQYLILPKGIRSKEPKEFENYDAFLEHLRLKNIAETEHKRAHFSERHH